MMQGKCSLPHTAISTNDIVQIITDLLDGRISLEKAYKEVKSMEQRISLELNLYASTSLVVEKPEDWCIHNSAKAETRGAILESLLNYIEKRLVSRGEK